MSDTPTDPANKATILVVEDEEPVRKLITTILTRAGYRVLAAEDATEAAQLLTSEESRIDLLIADIMLPGLSGAELAREILVDHPDIKVIFMSGGGRQAVSDATEFIPNQRFISKPYTPDAIVAAVRESLA